MTCEWGIVSATKINEFWKNIKNRYFLYLVFPVLLKNNTTISPPKKWLSTRIFIWPSNLNHLCYKPKTIKLFFSWVLWVRWMKGLMNFLNFLLWQYTMVIHHEQCIFIIYNSAGRGRNKFQQLSKSIELKFISITSAH